MKRTSYRTFRLLACVAATACLLPGMAGAGDLLLPFAPVLTGKTHSTTPPGIEATFQTLSPGTVRLTISNLDLTAKERVDRLYLNLDPSLNPRELTFTCAGGTGDFYQPKIAAGANRFSTPA